MPTQAGDAEQVSAQQGNLWLSFWPLWLLANVIGFYFIPGVFALPAVATGFSAGVFLALLQWLVLRRYMGVDYTWMAASIAVYSMFFPIATFWGLASLMRFFATCVACLSLLGLLQRAVLSYVVDDAGLWVIASPFGCLLGLGIALIVASSGGRAVAAFWLIEGSMYGALTGAVLVCLKQQTKTRPDIIPPWRRA